MVYLSLPKLHVLGIESCCEVDDLSCLGVYGLSVLTKASCSVACCLPHGRLLFTSWLLALCLCLASITDTGLDIGLWQPLARGASESENPLAPQKTHWPPPKTCNDRNAHFCTLGLYITKNKYELTLPSEFCRFPVKIMAAYEPLKKQTIKKKNCGGPNWPDSLKKALGPAGT